MSQNQGYGVFEDDRPSKTPFIVLAVLALLVVVGLAGFVYAVGGPGAQERSMADGAAQAESSDQDSSANGAAQTNTAATPTTVPLEDGRIVMTLHGSKDTYVKTGESYIESGVHVLDVKEGDLTSSVTTSGSVDTSKPGDYTVTYTVRNAAGMEDSIERTVHVTDDMAWDSDGISVLMYHYVYTDEDQPDEVNSNYINQKTLEEQLKWLTDNGYYYPSWFELRAYIDGTHSLPAKSVVLTFDDGQYGFLDYGIPLLEKYKVPATAFLIGDNDNTEEIIHEKASPYIDFQNHSYAMHTGGSTAIGHGGRIYDLTAEQITADLQKLSDMLGTNEAFAYPYGDVSDAAPGAVKDAGLLCAFTTAYDQVHVGDNPYTLPRIRIFGESSLESFVYQVQTGA